MWFYVHKHIEVGIAHVDTNKYKLSFTAASLSISESVKIAEVYLGCKDWAETKRIIGEENLLQSRTNSRTVRTYRELAQRLQLLSNDQLELLVDGNLQEKKYLLWFAVCKRYKFIQEFAVEVIHEKFLSMDYEFTELDYDAFFNRKADWHEELDQITETTKNKLKQVIFRMLREAEITSEDNMINQALLSRRLVQTLSPDAPISYRIFPLQIADVEG
jgi:hypothetical protein